MGSTPEPPAPPDPNELIGRDAQVNRIDQFNPFGSLQFSGPDRNIATQTLSPELQGILDQRLQSDSSLLSSALQRMQGLNNQPIDLSQFGPIQSQFGDSSRINFQGPQTGNLPGLEQPDFQGSINTSGLPGIPQNIEQFRGDVEQSVFDRGRALLDPVFSDQQRSLDQRLANQGLPRSGEAVDREQTRFGDIQSRAFTDLANQAVVTGGQEASRSLGDILSARGQGFGEGLAGGQFANQAGLMGLGAQQGIRGQLFGEGLDTNQANNQSSLLNQNLQQQNLQNQNAGRAQGLFEQQGIRGNQFQELMSLLGGQQNQIPGMDSFFSPGQVDTLGAFGMEQQGEQFNFQQQQNQNNALMSGLFGLGGSIIGGPVGGAIGSGIGGMFKGRRQTQPITFPGGGPEI